MRPVDRPRLLGGGGFAELAGHRAADVVGSLFDGGEIEALDGLVGPEEVRGDRFQDGLETWVEVGLRR